MRRMRWHWRIRAALSAWAQLRGPSSRENNFGCGRQIYSVLNQHQPNRAGNLGAGVPNLADPSHPLGRVIQADPQHPPQPGRYHRVTGSRRSGPIANERPRRRPLNPPPIPAAAADFSQVQPRPSASASVEQARKHARRRLRHALGQRPHKMGRR